MTTGRVIDQEHALSRVARPADQIAHFETDAVARTRRLAAAVRTPAGSNARARASTRPQTAALARATRDRRRDGRHDLVVGRKTSIVFLRNALIADPNAELAAAAFDQR